MTTTVEAIQRLKAWHPEVQGWSDDILPFYETIAKDLPIDAKCVESGIYRGRSLFFLAELLVAKAGPIDPASHRIAAELWSVDPLMWDAGLLVGHFLTNWQRFPAAVQNVVKLLRAPATQAARMFDDRSLDFVFIDGDHEYPSVREDLDAWLPKVKVNGIISGHDYAGLYGNFPGVAKAVHETFGTDFISEPHSAVWWRRV